MVLSDQHRAITRELLVRYLDAWTPAALHSSRRVTYASNAGPDSSLAALRVFGEFADRLAGHRLAMVLTAPDAQSAAALGDRLRVVHSELGGPAELTLHVTAGDLSAALTERTAITNPIFGYLEDGADPAPVAAGRHAELLLAVDPAAVPARAGGAARAAGLAERYRATLGEAGLTAALHVELVDHSGHSQLLVFATAVPKHLEKFKDELWAVDEYAGVRYRDPRDAGQTLLDISLSPDLAPLRRAVLGLVARGGRTVTDLRQYAAAETVYRAADITRLLTPLLSSGVLTRDPARGRLTPDTVIGPGKRR